METRSKRKFDASALFAETDSKQIEISEKIEIFSGLDKKQGLEMMRVMLEEIQKLRSQRNPTVNPDAERFRAFREGTSSVDAELFAHLEPGFTRKEHQAAVEFHNTMWENREKMKELFAKNLKIRKDIIDMVEKKYKIGKTRNSKNQKAHE